jgi:hypothetical protein
MPNETVFVCFQMSGSEADALAVLLRRLIRLDFSSESSTRKQAADMAGASVRLLEVLKMV